MPFTVITVKNVPQSLRGDLTKWMQEIATGVFVGNFNVRIREELWKRVVENVKQGEATLSYYYRNEIGYSFDTINSQREVVDFDGIPLVVFPQETKEKENIKLGFSNASKLKFARNSTPKTKNCSKGNYVVVDIETDGLDENKNKIIEIGAVKIENTLITEFNTLINHTEILPDNIVALTGITNEMLEKEGIAITEALDRFLEFIKDMDIVGYNVDFDIRFLNKELKKQNKDKIKNGFYHV